MTGSTNPLFLHITNPPAPPSTGELPGLDLPHCHRYAERKVISDLHPCHKKGHSSKGKQAGISVMNVKLFYDLSLSEVSREMGHERGDITEHYLRRADGVALFLEFATKVQQRIKIHNIAGHDGDVFPGRNDQVIFNLPRCMGCCRYT